MKIYMGPYRGWFGPYQLTNLLRYVGVSEKTCDKIAEKIPAGPFQWVHDLFSRKIKIRIDPYDTWSMDHTLSQIILPMLIQLRETKHGSPFVKDEDVPDHLKRSAAPPVEKEWDIDDNFHLRWEYVLDEMIYAHSKIADDDDWFTAFRKDGVFDREGYEKEKAKIDNGLRLFGVYYQGLWD